VRDAFERERERKKERKKDENVFCVNNVLLLFASVFFLGFSSFSLSNPKSIGLTNERHSSNPLAISIRI